MAAATKTKGYSPTVVASLDNWMASSHLHFYMLINRVEIEVLSSLAKLAESAHLLKGVYVLDVLLDSSGVYIYLGSIADTN